MYQFIQNFRVYYVNNVSRTTQWNRPTRPASDSEPALLQPQHVRSNSHGTPSSTTLSLVPPASGQLQRSRSNNNSSFDNSMIQSLDQQADVNISLPSELEGSNNVSSNIPSSRTIQKLNSIQTLFDKITMQENRNNNTAENVETNNRFSNNQLDETLPPSISSPASPCSSTTVSPTNPKTVTSDANNVSKNIQNGTKSPRNSVILINSCLNSNGQPVTTSTPSPDRIINTDLTKTNKLNNGSAIQTTQLETVVTETQPVTSSSTR